MSSIPGQPLPLGSIISSDWPPSRDRFLLCSFDKSEIFLHPVSLDDAPDYLQIITNPMDFVSIDNKITRHEYLNIQEFLVSPPSSSLALLACHPLN